MSWREIDRADVPSGCTLVLYRRGQEFAIRADGLELMSNRRPGSEEELARLACSQLPEQARVLVGGLGMGFTLRAALDRLGSGAKVVVSELVPEVVGWNRRHLGELADRPLDDTRVEVRVGDVARHLSQGPWDAVILDVDNGPEPLVREGNGYLYGPNGLAAIGRALSRHGRLAVWSLGPDRAFELRLRLAGFHCQTVAASVWGRARQITHTIFLARLRH
ncbi:MAG: hypothetical protein KC910_06485 [Candidatus Eremiobacteraeota bacterium]|nr:hypothetical protein [Candidatus Eremiobacteraeota bacterium]